MKTFVICTSPFGKAVSNYFFLLAEAISKEGNRVILITDQNKPELLPANTGNQIFLSWPSRRPTRFRDFIFFYKVCKKYKPQVTLGQFGSTNVVLLVSRFLGVRTVFNYWHTMFEQLKIDSIKGTVWSYLMHLRKRLILKYCATHILTNSLESKNDLSTHYKISQNKIHVFYFLIPDYFKNRDIPGKQSRGRIISFVARLDKSKGHVYIIEEMPQLLCVFPDIKLYIIGEGKEKEHLQALCSQLGIEEHVVFTGGVSLEKVYHYVSISMIHVSASEQEAFGLVNAEALSAGTPILANKVGGIKEILEDRKNGFFYNPKKRGDFATKVTSLLKEDWQLYSRSARNSYLIKFSDSDINIGVQLDRLKQLIRQA